MRTIQDAKWWIFDQLVTAKTNNDISISGEIYIDMKPGIGKEDIVVNAIVSDSRFWQNTVLNVNCYVPDIEVRTEGKVVMMPNFKRLRKITSDVTAAIKDKSSDQKYRSWIEQTVQFKEEQENAHYMNFRIQLHALNY